jgi:hypothetical protein
MTATQEAWDRAAEVAPFSNSTEGEAWMEAWCYQCSNDGCGVGKDNPQCPLLTVAYSGRTPAEWFDQTQPGQPPRLGDQYHCLMFRRRGDEGGREPRPVPDPPGQLTLLPREPYTGVRMPLMAPERTEVSA